MPQIGWFEILIIVAIAIVVIGPKDFPFMLKKIGSWIGSIKRYVANIQHDVSTITNETINEDLSDDDSKSSIKKEKNEQKSK